MVVIFTASCFTGCVTPRHIDEIKAEIGEVKTQTAETNDMVARMDSIISAGAEANNKLRNEISTTVNELQQQIDILLENYNELLAQMQLISQKKTVTHIIQSSPGSQSEPSKGDATTDTETPAIDCTITYDDSFILVRRGEYEKAIEGFEKFLSNCPTHESVENAHYWIGECYYSLEKYIDAVEKFDYLISNFKSSINTSRAMYKLARSKQELGKTEEAKQYFQKLIDAFPETLEANQAKERLKDLK
ncbi:MAG: tol-pal system protein YbgF [Candidatus Zixiibacteriota bacterium]